MSFPTITFKHTNTKVMYRLQDLLTEKFQSLERYVTGTSDIQCEVEFSKVAPRRNGALYRTEVNLWHDGILYRAEATEDTFERAIDEVRSGLETELQRVRTKRVSLWRKGARRMKEMMLLGS